MTGQGDRNMDMIRKSQARKVGLINVEKEYRTIEGLRTRGLRKFQTSNTIVKGERAISARMITRIEGQVWMKDELTGAMEWITRYWDERGEDLLEPSHSLVEYFEPVVSQPNLF